MTGGVGVEVPTQSFERRRGRADGGQRGGRRQIVDRTGANVGVEEQNGTVRC